MSASPKIEDSYNFRRLSETLTTSGVVRREALEVLAAQGYQVVVNLLPDSSEHAIAQEREIIAAQGIEYLHIPVDFAQPSRQDFARFGAVLQRVQGKKVHIHCAANFRVSAFYALYQVEQGAWSKDRAQEFIGGIWRPEQYPVWGEFIAAILTGS